MTTTKDKSQGPYREHHEIDRWIVLGPTIPHHMAIARGSGYEAHQECDRLNAAYAAGQAAMSTQIDKIRKALMDGGHVARIEALAALSELEARQPGNVLTDECMEGIAAKCCHGETSQIMKATVPNGPVPLSQGENIRRHIVMALRYARDNGYLAPAAGLTVEEIMEAFDEAVEATIEHGDEDEHDWLDINDVRIDILSRLTKLVQP